MLCWFENINETWPGKWKAFKLRTFCVCVWVINVFLWTEFESLILSTKTCIFSYIKSLVSLISNECNIWHMISFDCKFLEKYLFESFLCRFYVIYFVDTLKILMLETLENEILSLTSYFLSLTSYWLSWTW